MKNSKFSLTVIHRFQSVNDNNEVFILKIDEIRKFNELKYNNII